MGVRRAGWIVPAAVPAMLAAAAPALAAPSRAVATTTMQAPRHAAGPPTTTMPPSQRAAPAASSPLPSASASQDRRGRLRRGLYAGGAFDRFVQFVSVDFDPRSGRAEERASLLATCDGPVRSVLDNVRLIRLTAQSGRFSGSLPVAQRRIPPGLPGLGGLTRTGTVDFDTQVQAGGRAVGTIRSRFTLRDDSGTVFAACETGTVRWSGRIAPPAAKRGRPRPRRGGYYGRTAQRQPFLLQVLAGGRAVRPAGMTFEAGCPSLAAGPLDLAATVRMPIFGRGRFGADGSFRRNFTSQRFGPITESYRWRLRGRFGARGAAGTWRVDGVARRDSDGKRVDTCTTGRNGWRALR